MYFDDFEIEFNLDDNQLPPLETRDFTKSRRKRYEDGKIKQKPVFPVE